MISETEVQELVRDFQRVAELAGAQVNSADINVEILKAPHRPPSRLSAGKMAVYVFSYGDWVLKVGKVGPRSQARYTSQHYNPISAPSTLAATLLKRGNEIDVSNLNLESVGDWIKSNTDRFNFILRVDCGAAVLTLLEAFLQCRLRPKFEGFASQK